MTSAAKDGLKRVDNMIFRVDYEVSLVLVLLSETLFVETSRAGHRLERHPMIVVARPA